MPSQKPLAQNNQQAQSKWRSRHFRQWELTIKALSERFYGVGRG
jgi:hypothetical protein